MVKLMWYQKYLFSVATYRSELTNIGNCEAEHARKLIMRTLDFSSHSKASINIVSVYDLFSSQTMSFFYTWMKKYTSMLL